MTRLLRDPDTPCRAAKTAKRTACHREKRESLAIMGKHTAYWRQYQKAQVHGSLRIVAAIAAWLSVVILVVLARQSIGALFPIAIVGVFAGLIVSVIVLAKDAYKVACPECGTDYKRSKWFGQCPSCGLKLLQDDP